MTNSETYSFAITKTEWSIKNIRTKKLKWGTIDKLPVQVKRDLLEALGKNINAYKTMSCIAGTVDIREGTYTNDWLTSGAAMLWQGE